MPNALCQACGGDRVVWPLRLGSFTVGAVINGRMRPVGRTYRSVRQRMACVACSGRGAVTVDGTTLDGRRLPAIG